MLFSLATLKAKLIAGGVILALIMGGVFYVRHLNNHVESLKKDNIELSTQANAATDTVQENDRRDKAVDDINSLIDKKRAENETKYQNKVEKVDTYVQQGKDRPVGPLLNEFFNNGL